MPQRPEDVLVTGAAHLLAGKYFQLAAFVMLIYDHFLTFPQEIERIWTTRFSGATFLFLLNRYITPLQFIIIIHAFHDPIWSKEVCDNFVVFEGASTVVMVAVCEREFTQELSAELSANSCPPEVIMILRVYALYNRSNVVLTFLLLLWIAQISVSAVGLRTGFAVPLPPELTGCILTGSSSTFSLVWVSPLVTDTCIFALTLWRTREYISRSGSAPTLHLFVRDGVLYFLVIFMANLLNTLLFFLAPDDLRAIGASFSQLITALMVSRLVLNLRSNPTSEEDDRSVSYNVRFVGTGKDTVSTIWARTLGDLGEDVEGAGNYTEEVQREEYPMRRLQ
ncbi:hypothetical protein NLJ89_g7831 [Agrocybe chaxingu]|uniref:DUF6533 domain-containing protein n=1 Tax=Agrocybe chaxingu TaxID=84603 RepID=A0A9W8JWJ0_9AGAR|nr:hypothetical protein NLJ89_g7831 [Agrocybe chaxingu]